MCIRDSLLSQSGRTKNADFNDNGVPLNALYYLNEQCLFTPLFKMCIRDRNGMVDAKEDNMLKITNDGRKLALDQRLINPLLPDFEDSKLNALSLIHI